MSGDDLTIALFLVGLAATFFVAAVSQAGWKHWLLISGLFGLSGTFLVAGFGWPWVKDVSPRLTTVVSQIATSPVAWFVVIILGLTASFFINRQSRVSPDTNPAVTAKQMEPDVREWFAPWAAALKFASKDVIADHLSFDATFAELQKQESALAAITPQRVGRMGPGGGPAIEPPDPKRDQQRAELAGLRESLIATKNAQARSLGFVAMDMRAKLQRGNIVARGFTSLAVGREAKIIPSTQWSLLGLDLINETAVGDDLEYKGVTIGKPYRPWSQRKWRLLHNRE